MSNREMSQPPNSVDRILEAEICSLTCFSGFIVRIWSVRRSKASFCTEIKVHIYMRKNRLRKASTATWPNLVSKNCQSEGLQQDIINIYYQSDLASYRDRSLLVSSRYQQIINSKHGSEIAQSCPIICGIRGASFITNFQAKVVVLNGSVRLCSSKIWKVSCSYENSSINREGL